MGLAITFRSNFPDLSETFSEPLRKNFPHAAENLSEADGTAEKQKFNDQIIQLSEVIENHEFHKSLTFLSPCHKL